MHYDISLTITYSYDHASDHARNLVHLLPLDIPGVQQVASSELSIDPAPQERVDGVDFFGNRATWITFHNPIAAFSLNLTTEATRHNVPEQEDRSPRLEQLAHEIDATQSLAPHAPQHFLSHSPRIEPDASMTAFARAQLRPDMSVRQAVLAIGAALHAEMTFDAAATDVLTTPGEAFAARRGVCQDFTQVMIACLRGLGIPAGYVSGFLRTIPPPGQRRLEGADAMHAWVRAWCGAETGWIEYDPTNAIIAGDGHIVVAYGRDYSDVSPVRGISRTAGAHDTAQVVDVVPVTPEDTSAT